MKNPFLRLMLLLVLLSGHQKGEAQLNFDTTFHVALNPGWATNYNTSWLSDGNLWCVGSNVTYSFFDGSTWSKFQIPNEFGQIRGIALDEQGTLWAGTFGDGLYKKEGGTWSKLTAANSMLPSDDLRAVQFDTIQKELWLATYGGLVRIKNGVWDIFTTANSLLESNFVTDIEQSADGAIWVIAGSRIHKIVNGIWTSYNYSAVFAGFDDNFEDIFIGPDQKIWVAGGYGQAGAASFNGSNWKVLPGFSGKNIQSVGANLAGTVFLGELFKGLHVVHGGLNYFFPSSPVGFPSAQNFDFTASKDGQTLWMCNTWGLWQIGSTTVGNPQISGPTAGLTAFPVPAFDKISIGSEASGIHSIQVFATTGELVDALFYRNETLVEVPVAHLPAGIYLLKTELADGRQQVIQVAVSR